MSTSIPFPQFFNELSFVAESNLDVFYEKLNTLISVIKEMNSIGFGFEFAYSKDLLDIDFLDGKPFGIWLRSRPKNLIENKIKTLLIALIFNQGKPLEDIYKPDQSVECFYYNTPLNNLSGLVAAYNLGLPTIALQNKEFIDHYEFNITVRKLNKNKDDTVDCEDYEDKAISISQSRDIDRIFDDNAKRIFEEIKNGQDLLEHSDIMLSSLVFSNTAKDQLKNMSAADFSKNGFVWVCKELLFLNHTIFKTTTEKRDFFSITGSRKNIAPSETKETQKAYPGSRTFVFENGEQRECWAHDKNIALNIRIYFDCDNTNSKIYIGHIGKPLPVASHVH